LTPAIGHQFHVWFVKYEAALQKDTMIMPVCEAAGLGSPPDQFSQMQARPSTRFWR